MDIPVNNLSDQFFVINVSLQKSTSYFIYMLDFIDKNFLFTYQSNQV